MSSPPASPPERPGRAIAKIPSAELPGLSGLLTLSAAVAIIAALYIGREVLVPITLAVLLSFVLAPLVALLRRSFLGRIPAVLLSVVLALGVIMTLSGVIGLQVADLATSIPRYADTIRNKVDQVRAVTLGNMAGILADISRETAGAAKPPEPQRPTTLAPSQAAPAKTGDADKPPKPVLVEVQPASLTPLEIAERILMPILSPLSTAGIVFLVAVFVLLQQEDLRDRLIRLFGSDDLHRTTAALDEAGRRLSRYFLAQIALNATFGVVIGVGLAMIGVPNPILWGILAALFRFVPYIGSAISALLPAALAAAVDPGWSMVVWTGALFLVSESLMGQAVEPMVYGHSTGLSPVSVVVAAIFWGWLWGPVGLILSMPLTLCLVVLGRHVKRLEFIDVLLGDRPALTPVESFYQRILAGDPDEAQAYAETLLKSRSLSAYYDGVALPGLQLATIDAARGVLTAEQIDSIHVAVAELIIELDGYDDIDPGPTASGDGPSSPTEAEAALPRPTPPPDLELAPADRAPGWQHPQPVLCIAGRGPLDDLAGDMLAQLLDKHGIGTRRLAHSAATREHLHTLDLDGVAMVCISAIDIVGGSSSLRFMVRRLRRVLPGTPILVLLPIDAEDPTADRLRTAIAADLYSHSLQDSVTTCVEAARRPTALASAA